ncbi:C-terminal processing protease CtpA/Prc, contains a PDZ domain [Algoriphagus locisalis]|uniref:C-terminal processing protease CtpA/Prc, contains a PDZ domain n=1 Tax=Algoriphagus locisalis TaxID=305507 RepID=A0A1I7C8J0_9BACT|nr:S41 family peptidase [Algoriphagus locisalis]SFT95694.1 C-terminal processing protease CtpA/Prc, contains a PDZ domain [Algoriphagus locisalis]
MTNSKWMLGIAVLFLWSCNPKDEIIPDPQSEQVRAAILESMEEWYFWNEELPTTVNTANYSSNEELLNAITFKPLDRFSYLTTQEAFNNAFVGRNAGHGFGFAFDAAERLYLTFVYEESPSGIDGWQRGWEIIEINGKTISSYRNASGGYDFQLGPADPGITNSFTFKLPDGTTTTRSNVKAEYQSNSVLHQEIIDLNGKKVGYWVYQSFKATAGQSPTKSLEVDESMAFFTEAGIDELIIDLRYNGGGSVAVAEQINNYLIQASNSSKLMYTNKLNSLKTDLEKSVNFKKAGSLNLEKLVFITSRGSASASELVINSLNPYLDITLVGDNTFGKPVGSFPLSNYNKTLKDNNVELVPITFATANADGNADYFDGFPVDFAVGDSPQFNWGDQDDLRLAAALLFLENGSVSGRLTTTFYRPKWEMIDAFKGLNQEFPAY